MKTIVVIPTYNEARNIGELLRRIRALQPDFDILVVDDNSPDGTGRVASESAAALGHITVLSRPYKDGYGRAYIHGLSYVLSHSAGYERIVQMDADLSHSPGYLGVLCGAIGQHDIVIGSRYVPGGGISDWSAGRRVISFAGNACARFFLGNSVRDWTSGFRVFSRKVIAGIDLPSIRSRGYLFQIEVLYRCLRKKYPICEIPIEFVDRKQGRTKIGVFEIGEAIGGIVCLYVLSILNPAAIPAGSTTPCLLQEEKN
jgi:dolichol-phosphate mannosyltransferase